MGGDALSLLRFSIKRPEHRSKTSHSQRPAWKPGQLNLCNDRWTCKGVLVSRTFRILLQCSILSASVSAYAQRGDRGAPPAPKPDNAQSLSHTNAAKNTAS